MPPESQVHATLTVVGSGTLLPSDRRTSACFHLGARGSGLLLDCGTGALHRLAALGLDWEEITTIALTHFHSDHVSDLPGLLAAYRFVGRTSPLTLVGPVGLHRLLERMAAVYGTYVVDPGFRVEVVEVEPGADGVPLRPAADELAGCTLRAVSTPHTPESVAYRVEGDWGTVGYTGDTGPSVEVARFLTGVSVLVSECALADPPSVDTHLSPAGVVDLARTAEPGLLVLTHVYPPQRPEEARGAVQGGWPGDVVCGYDGLRLRIGPDAVGVDPSSGVL